MLVVQNYFRTIPTVSGHLAGFWYSALGRRLEVFLVQKANSENMAASIDEESIDFVTLLPVEITEMIFKHLLDEDDPNETLLVKHNRQLLPRQHSMELQCGKKRSLVFDGEGGRNRSAQVHGQ